MIKKLSNGFTLVELMVVIGIIGVLAGGLLVVINPISQINKANDTKRKNDLDNLRKALELYYQDFGEYPGEVSGNHGFTVRVSGSTADKDFSGSGTGSIWDPYMQRIPNDPRNGANGFAYFSNGGLDYKIYTHLDALTNEVQNCQDGNTDGVCDAAASVQCGSSAAAKCNYGVSSPNVSP